MAAVQQSPQLKLALDEATKKQADLRVLRNRYTDESAPVQLAKAELEALEQRSIPALARQLVAEIAARETAINPRVDSAFGYLRRVPPLALDEARLKRDVANAEELVSNVGHRYETTRLSLSSSLPWRRDDRRPTSCR